MANLMQKTVPAQRIKMRIRMGDTVQVINGKEKGKTGEVLKILPLISYYIFFDLSSLFLTI